MLLVLGLACASKFAAKPLESGWESRAPDLSSREQVNILLLGDAGNPGDKLDSVSESAVRVCGEVGCDLGLFLGDNIYPDGVTGSDDQLWSAAVVEPWTPLAQGEMRLWAAMGNHDWRTGREGAQGQIDFSDHPSNPNGIWLMPDLNYTVPGLPSWLNLYMFDSVSEIGLFRKNRWLRGLEPALAEADGWQLLGAHHLAMSSGTHSKLPERHDERIGRVLGRLSPHVDVLLSGHDHHQELLFDGELVQVIQGNSSKTRSTYKTKYTRHQRWIVPEEQPGFARIEATEAALTFIFYDGAGAEIYRSTLRRDGDQRVLQP